MSYELDPIPGQWYRRIDKGLLFRVVSIDEDDDLIQIQSSDGELEELDSEAWFEMDLDRAEEPEDWVGSADDVEVDELADGDSVVAEDAWRAPRRSAKRPRESWDDDDEPDDFDDDLSDDERDDYER